MAVDPLVDRLVRDLKPVRPRTGLRDGLVIGAICLAELAVFVALGAMRPDVPVAMEHLSFWWKLTSLGLIAAVGLVVALVSLNPVESPRPGLRWEVAIIAACLAAGWGIDVTRDGLPALATRLDWPNGVQCVWQMVALSIPAVIGLGVLIRRGAPTEAVGTAVISGITAAAWGAFVFVFACPYDDPFYVAAWYAVGCGLVVCFARVVLPPLARW